MNPAYYEKLAQIESGGDPNAKNPKSSAKGLFQFTSATAEQYGLDDPTDPVKAREAVEKFTADNASQLQKVLGRTPSDGELYLAHQQGSGGALKLLTNPDKKAIEVVGVDAVINNGGDENMTAKEFADKWVGKFGGQPENKYAKTIQLPDGGTINLNGTEDPQTLLKLKIKIIEKYGGNITIDRKSGAPAAVRAFVGSVNKSDDKIASLQKYYPDAIPYGEDNFVFTNPDTGKLTLYNPRGLDLGDVASISRESAQVVGGTVGAALGAGTGLAVSIPTGFTAAPVTLPAGAMAGAGLGVASSGAAFDALINFFGLTEDTRSPGQRAIDFGVDTATGMAGEGIGRGASYVGGKLINAASKKTKQLLGGGGQLADDLVKQFRSFDIEPTPSLVTNNAGYARLEAGLQQNPLTAETMIKQAQSVVDKTHKAVSKIVGEIGEPRTTQGAGEAIKQAAINSAERFGFKQEKLYSEAFDLIGDETPVGAFAVEALGNEIRAEIAKSPNTMGAVFGPVLKQIDNIVADASGGGIPFKSLRQIRTAIGRDLDNPLLTGSTGSQNEAMKRVYGALTEDLANAATATSTEAAKKLKTADRFTRMWMNTAADTMNKIARFDADEKAFKFAMASAKDGGSSLARLRKNFTPEEWDTVAASVIDKLGDASAGMQNGAGDAFSINTFLTNYNKLSPEAKTALLGGSRYKGQREALEKLTGLMGRIKEVSRFSNTSNTAGAIQAQLYLSALGGGLGYAYSGNYKGAAIGAAAAFTPRMAAKLLTSPKFVTWLSEPLEQATKAGSKFTPSEHLGRLALIAKEEPDLSDEIKSFIKQIEHTTK